MAFATIDVTKGISGTIPVANGGTGVASGTTGQFLKFTGTTTIASAAVSGNPITEVDQWRVTSNFSGDANPIASNWERNDTDFEKIGTGLTESSGYFSFPVTGKYRIDAQHLLTTASASDSQYNELHIRFTSNNTTYYKRATASSLLQITAGTDGQAINYCTCIVDVTDTSNCKFMLNVEVANNNTVTLGASDRQFTGFTVVRLGDT
tara:strand:- start:46 stop:666 length:621 start_codon:yes stop_codon:yes gene_type:complete